MRLWLCLQEPPGHRNEPPGRVELPLKWGSVWWKSYFFFKYLLNIHTPPPPLLLFFAGFAEDFRSFNLTCLLIVYIGWVSEASPLGLLQVSALLYVRLRSTYGYIQPSLPSSGRTLKIM